MKMNAFAFVASKMLASFTQSTIILVYKTFSLRIVFSASAEKPRDKNRDDIQAHHRRGKQHHIWNVGGRRNYCRDN